jgi:hypothetical protein
MYEIFKILIAIQLLILLLFFLGSTINKFLIFEKTILNKILFGYCIFIFTLNTLYVLFNFKITNILLIYSLLFCILFLLNLKFFFFYIKKLFVILFPISILFFLPVLIYGEQFYVFRGNYWDSFNYISSAILFKNYNYADIMQKNYLHIFSNFQNIDSIVKYRPLANIITSLFFFVGENNVFLSYYATKVFFVSLIFVSITIILKNFFKKINQCYFISLVFILSFWTLYIFEIDALSQLSAIPLFLFIINNIKKILMLYSERKINLFEHFQILILISSILLLYPEICFILLIFFGSFILVNFKKFTNLNFLKNTILIFFFSLLTLSFFATNYLEFIKIQINAALTQKDWWGYYGGFILGNDNLIIDKSFVYNLKNLIKDHGLINGLIFIHNQHFDNNYYFIYLNIFPSLMGYYNLMPGKIDNFLEFVVSLFLTVSIYFLLIYSIKHNFNTLKINKFFKEIICSMIIFFVFILYLVLNKNLWTIIKIYTFVFPLIFIFLSINFNKRIINKILIVLYLIFPIYKYSQFNFGIGRHDSFPSILNKEYKENIHWNLQISDLEKCNFIKIETDDYFIRVYLLSKILNKNIEFFNLKYNSSSDLICNIKFDNKNFLVEY